MSQVNYSVNELANIANGSLIYKDPSHPEIAFLITDSRKISNASNSLFFAIKGESFYSGSV
jgi:UDP-N-acetylmuramyl pentapeptide synthase